MPADVALTLFHGRAGDHDDRAMAAGPLIAAELGRRLGVPSVVAGRPEPALGAWWDVELAAARPTLEEMAARIEEICAAGRVPVSATSRCAVALATVPVVVRHHPGVVVWFDAHADLNTPATTTTGHLGGPALSGPAGLWESGLGSGLSPDGVVLVGARDADPPEQALLDAGGVRAVPPGPGLPARLADAVGDRPVYVHLDCDVLEPGTVPTDHRVPGGLTLEDLHAAAGVLAGRCVLGVEVGGFEAVWEEGGDPASPAPLLDALEPLLRAAAGR